MNRNEQEYYANINGIARALDRIANALENNNKEDKIYYKTRKDMFMDNPCTKEEYEAHKANNIPGFEGTLDALDNLCNVGTNPKNDPERDKFGNDIPCKIDGITNDSDYDVRVDAKYYFENLECNDLGNPEAYKFRTKKDCILDYVTTSFRDKGARYTDIIKFAYYLGAHNAPKFNPTDNRGYYAMAFNTRFNGHLVQGGKDFLVKGINKKGKERY